MDTTGYKQALLTRKAELDRRLGRIAADLTTARSPDSEERAVEAENDEVLEGLGQAGEAELKAIDAALERIAHGTYGFCTACEEPISPERLTLLPATPFCQLCAPGGMKER
ncbi:TraR/DksA family transcriptional regulator [Rhizobium paknamense]|uniref:RNA polymerase-binding transcription factor DksA n=1 Tax=Rhizobium paknamense TaxID=1206817 RepID=A0ABU0I809_9HYPH|nr:TraR/DksA family transcriptional regulator [Rhizobium paknamense]MDQ0454347.1 RNA polymerase-binding transcription factor DksA [Rhizobium paknamense]